MSNSTTPDPKPQIIIRSPLNSNSPIINPLKLSTKRRSCGEFVTISAYAKLKVLLRPWLIGPQTRSGPNPWMFSPLLEAEMERMYVWQLLQQGTETLGPKDLILFVVVEWQDLVCFGHDKL
ncbi:hypothetical protein HanRHA438_Chr06g0266301 [Helianthus annuus]|nr:hypothetical protein HanRHA438_Chr06g0266301 [Helianthus annuus]